MFVVFVTLVAFTAAAVTAAAVTAAAFTFFLACNDITFISNKGLWFVDEFPPGLNAADLALALLPPVFFGIIYSRKIIIRKRVNLERSVANLF